MNALFTIIYHDGCDALSTLAHASECCRDSNLGADIHSTEPTDGTYDGPAIGWISADGTVTMLEVSL